MIKRNWRTLLILIVVSVDVIAIIVSACAAYVIRSFFPNLPPLSTYISIEFEVAFGLLLIFSAMIIGVYRATSHSNSIRQYYLAGKAYLYTLLSLFLFCPCSINAIPRRFTILFFFILPFVFLAGRFLFNHFVQFMLKRGYGVHNVLLAGYDNGVMEIIHRFNKFPELGYDIKGIVTNLKKDAADTCKCCHGVLVPKYSMAELESAVIANDIDRAFVPSTNTVSNGYKAVLSHCRKHNVKLKVLSEDSDQLLHLSRVYDIAGITIFAPQRKRIDLMKRLLKRLFDIAFASLSLPGQPDSHNCIGCDIY